MIYLLIALGILVGFFLLLWGIAGILLSMLGMVLPILVAIAIFYLLYKLVTAILTHVNATENPLLGGIGIAMFVLILWLVF